MGGASYWKDEASLAGLLRTAEAAGFTIILAARTMVHWDDRFLPKPVGQ